MIVRLPGRAWHASLLHGETMRPRPRRAGRAPSRRRSLGCFADRTRLGRGPEQPSVPPRAGVEPAGRAARDCRAGPKIASARRPELRSKNTRRCPFERMRRTTVFDAALAQLGRRVRSNQQVPFSVELNRGRGDRPLPPTSASARTSDRSRAGISIKLGSSTILVGREPRSRSPRPLRGPRAREGRRGPSPPASPEKTAPRPPPGGRATQ